MTQAYIVEALRTAGRAPRRRAQGLASGRPWRGGARRAGRAAGSTPRRSRTSSSAASARSASRASTSGATWCSPRRLPDSVPAVTIDRQCGSSQQALHFAAQAVMSGTQDVVIAAGVESMTRVPMGIPTILAMQAGIGVGPWSEAIKDRYGVTEFSQFTGAEMIADKYGFDRATLDAFALDSHRKAAAATESGAFEREIVPLGGRRRGPRARRGHSLRRQRRRRSPPQDDRARRPDHRRQRQPDLRRRVGRAGGVRSGAQAHGLTPLARIDNLTVTAGDPVIMLEEPIPATRRALARSGRHIDEIDLYEVNEAFAPVPLAWLRRSAPIRRGSTSTAARSRSAIRSARAGPS